MAIVLGSALLTRLREAVGAENDTHVTDAELYRALTVGVQETWDTLLSMGIGTEGVKSATFSAVAGQQEYPKTTIAADFYQISKLLVLSAAGYWTPVKRYHPNEQYNSKAPTQGASMKLYYFPVAPVFTTGTETFDGINGWEEHAVMCACIYIKAKKEDDTGQYRSRKREIEARMSVMANRLRDEPPRIIRRRVTIQRGYSIPYALTVNGYDLRGANIELFG
jgi:hypothetical protein